MNIQIKDIATELFRKQSICDTDGSFRNMMMLITIGLFSAVLCISWRKQDLPHMTAYSYLNSAVRQRSTSFFFRYWTHHARQFFQGPGGVYISVTKKTKRNKQDRNRYKKKIKQNFYSFLAKLSAARLLETAAFGFRGRDLEICLRILFLELT